MGLRRFFKNQKQKRQIGKGFLIRNGLTIPTHRTGMITPILQQIYEDRYETPELTGIARTIRPGDRVLELGAGLGIISAIAARAAGPTGLVRSYEANPALLADTLTFFATNQVTNVTLVNAVLVNEVDPKTRQFHLAGSFAESSLLGAEGRGSQGTVEVRAESLSEVLAEFRPDVLICDIEGAEVELFPTFPPSSLRAAVVEIHPDRLTPAQVQSIHDGMAAQGLQRQQPGPGGTVEVYLRSPG